MAKKRGKLSCKYTMAKSKNGRAHKWQTRAEAHKAARAHAAASGGTAYVFQRCVRKARAKPTRIAECTSRGCKWY